MEKEYNYTPTGDEQLDEAIPRDLAQAYRYGNKADARSDNWTTSYGNIYANKETHREVKNQSHQRTSDIDFQAAEYKKLTQDEAVAIAKSTPEVLRIIFCGELITLRKDDKGKIKQDRHIFFDDVLAHAKARFKGENYEFYRSDGYKDIIKKFTRPNGEQVNSSSKLTVNTVLGRADAIYQVISEPKNPGRQDRDVMSKYFKDNDRLLNKYKRYRQPKNSWWSRYDDPSFVDRYSYAAGKGIDYRSPYSTTNMSNNEFRDNLRQISSELYSNRLGGWSAKSDFADMNLGNLNKRLSALISQYPWLKKLNGKTPDEFPAELQGEDFSQEAYNYYLSLNKAIKFIQTYTRWQDSDLRAAKINAYSDANLSEFGKRAIELKNKLKDLQSKISQKKDEVDNFESMGSPRARDLKRELESYQEKVIQLFKSMSAVEEQLKTAEADDAAEMAQLNKELGDLEQEYTNIKKKLGGVLTSTTKAESFSCDTGDDEDLGEGICFDNNLNEVWDDLCQVEDYDQEDEYLDDFIDD